MTKEVYLYSQPVSTSVLMTKDVLTDGVIAFLLMTKDIQPVIGFVPMTKDVHLYLQPESVHAHL